MNTLQRTIGHFKTITKHRHKVIVHCFKAGIGWQGLKHDLSKYSPVEFLRGVHYYTGKKSPNEGEREEYGYSLAWLHHKGRNKHHFEYWNDYNPKSKAYEPVKMPYRYLVEMFCDRVAASKIYNGKNYKDEDALNYFLARKEKRCIEKETSEILEGLLTMLSEKGEEETFKYIRSQVKKQKNLRRK